ncbi:MAG: hypothetical protein RID91_00600 [Azospirillaceae bacterium]
MAPGADARITEVVGRFETREAFRAAVQDLLAEDFASSDVSVLDTHESLTAAGDEGESWQSQVYGLVGEAKYIGPITTAGLIALAAGPLGAAIAGLVGAGVGVAAARELLEELRATPHTEAFARALEYGAVLLWVRAEEPERQERARAVLERHGAHDVHVHTRDRHEAE